MLAKRIWETAAMLVIGDSVLAIVNPRRHVSLWTDGPRWWERLVEPLARHRGVTRVLGLAGLGAGLWMASRQR